MLSDFKEYSKIIRERTDNGITATHEWAQSARDRVFNMESPPAMERVLKNRLRMLAIISMALAAMLLAFMLPSPQHFFTALVMGIVAAAVDFVVEYKGVRQNEWDYPARRLSFRKIPIELPLIFFSCGIAITFVHYALSNPITDIIFTPQSSMASMSYIQIALFATGTIFLVQYFRGDNRSLTLGALPISMALYLSYPQQWILVISIIPIYIDYYLEKHLVRTAHITYDNYGEEVATNVAISYFPVTIILLVLVTIILSLT